MNDYVIACDLGTGGNKAVLYDRAGVCRAQCTATYPTYYPRPNYHEQKPEDWWNSIVRSVRQLLTESEIDPREVVAIGLSGHSLGCVPLDGTGAPLLEFVPIWSDSRPDHEAAAFFERTKEVDWYLRTGNGFPPPLYPIFKILWLKNHQPDVFRRTTTVAGTKDYINFRLTGRLATDHSYASGSGIYDLGRRDYDSAFLDLAGIQRGILPEIVDSTQTLGTLVPDAASALGLPGSVRVVCGGVDNSCMALGAGNVAEGDVYTALGSSSWIAVTAAKPLLDIAVRPFVFAHVIPQLYNSATSIFSAGTSFNWIREQICRDLANAGSESPSYERMMELATGSPPGSNRLLFIPTLAGGTFFEGGPKVRGAFVGIDLSHTRADLIRAGMEGIAFGLRAAFDALRGLTKVREEILIFGGGTKSRLWREIYADTFGCTIIKSRTDQHTAALGAAALAAIGTGLWSDFATVKELHEVEERIQPDPARVALYNALLPAYRKAAQQQIELGHLLTHASRA